MTTLDYIHISQVKSITADVKGRVIIILHDRVYFTYHMTVDFNALHGQFILVPNKSEK